MRDARTDNATFRAALRELTLMLVYEATRDAPVVSERLHTPVAVTRGVRLAAPPLLVPVLRAGLGMAEQALSMIPEAQMGFVGMARDEHTHEPVPYMESLPDELVGRPVFVLDPMLATGGSMLNTVELLVTRGASDVTCVCALAAPEGIERLTGSGLPVRLVTASVDERLNDSAFIVPGPRRRGGPPVRPPLSVVGPGQPIRSAQKRATRQVNDVAAVVAGRLRWFARAAPVVRQQLQLAHRRQGQLAPRAAVQHQQPATVAPVRSHDVELHRARVVVVPVGVAEFAARRVVPAQLRRPEEGPTPQPHRRSQTQHAAGERHEGPLGARPFQRPGCAGVHRGAVGVVVAALGVAQLVAGQQHRRARREGERGQQRPHVAFPRGAHHGVRALALHPVVRRAVVVGAVAVVARRWRRCACGRS